MYLKIIKKIVFSLCLIYTVDIVISKMGYFIPINFYTLIIVYFFDFFGIIVIILMKYYY